MSYSFQKFENRHSRIEERITLTKSNSIGFPSEFYKKNKIKDYKYAVFFWDEANKAIGIHFTSDESEKKNAFLIARSKEGYGGSVSARSFLKHNNIDTQIYHGRYEWTKYTQDGIGELFVINLKAKT